MNHDYNYQDNDSNPQPRVEMVTTAPQHLQSVATDWLFFFCFVFNPTGDFQERTLPLPSDFSKLDNILFNKPQPQAQMVEVTGEWYY